MNKDKLIEKYLEGNGELKPNCPKCRDVMVFLDGEYLICLNEECDYTLRVLEGGKLK